MAYDLAVNLPLRTAPAARLREALARFPADEALLGYPTAGGGHAVREAIAAWMRRHAGFSAVDPRRLVLTGGARHALVLALRETCAPGDTLLMESLTYHGFRQAAVVHGARPMGVTMDADGMRPDAFEHAIRATGARTAYIQPTLHNPTTATMPMDRRAAIVDVARRHDVTLIEGDVYAALHDDPLPALAELAPERVLHAGGIGKVLGPGLRVGWLLLPDDTTQHRIANAIQMDLDGLPALLPSIVAGWMADGTADALLDELIQAVTRRNALARTLLGDGLKTSAGLHAWLPMAHAEGIVARAAAEGIMLAPPGRFHADEGPATGLRICLGAEEDPGRLEDALRALAQLL